MYLHLLNLIPKVILLYLTIFDLIIIGLFFIMEGNILDGLLMSMLSIDGIAVILTFSLGISFIIT